MNFLLIVTLNVQNLITPGPQFCLKPQDIYTQLRNTEQVLIHWNLDPE